MTRFRLNISLPAGLRQSCLCHQAGHILAHSRPGVLGERGSAAGKPAVMPGYWGLGKNLPPQGALGLAQRPVRGRLVKKPGALLRHRTLALHEHNGR